MKLRMAGVLLLMIALLSLMGCGNRNSVMPVPPEIRPVPGTLTGVTYETGGGMAWRTEFRIALTSAEVVHTAYWPEDVAADEMAEKHHVPVTAQQWADVEQVVLSLYPNLTEAGPAKPDFGMDAMVLDGGDYTRLYLTWQTADGEVQRQYNWPSDRRVRTLTALLEELADPRGREIPWYEAPELCRIYMSRNHKINTKRDYSFQLHWADYDEQDPHWELIYYLGKFGAVDQGKLRLEEKDWEAFLSFAEEIQLEYFPESRKSDDRFTCRLTYTDETYNSVVLNEDTESKLTQYFMNLLEQEN